MALSGKIKESKPIEPIKSKNGIHYHAELSVFINGKKQDIPAGVGLIGGHNPIHTHEADNIIHLEFNGFVKKDDTRLGSFFKIWGKDFSSQSIFEHKNGDDGMVKMLVNGKENNEYENYPMKDSDKIEIRYEL